MSKSSEKVAESLSEKVYVIYNSDIQVYEKPFVCRESELSDICSMLVNSVDSKYYNNSTSYDVYCIGEFDSFSGQISTSARHFITNLGYCVDDFKRRVQICIQTLNYLPIGYYKMSKEEQAPIQEKINYALSEYIEMFVIDNPDLLSQANENGSLNGVND